MLIDVFKQKCVMLDKTTVPDGLGGFVYDWQTGAQFEAAIVKDSTMQAKIAEKDGVTEVYTVTVARNTPLQYHDVFKRLSDNAVYRVTSEIADSQTPSVASFQFGQVSAERWELT